MSVDSPVSQQIARPQGVQLAIRSPFHAKIQHMWIHEDMTMSEIAASFMLHTQVATTIMCLNGTMVVDPNTVAKNCDQNGNYSFRIFPLLGGAKNEAVRQRIRTMLAAKGVPEDKLLDRLNGFASKVPLEKLASVADSDDEGFWNVVKSHASDARYRLITPAELKAHQQNQRKTKGKSMSKGSDGKEKGMPKGKGKGKGKAKGKGKPTVSASDIVVDMQHFISENGDISQLELSRFGADQSGLCIVTPQEAYNCLKTATKSCEPLALLIIGTHDQIKEFGEVYSIPAYGPNQTPIIVQACLLQFGDSPVTFRMNVPSVTIQSEATTTIEFCIMREYVSKWADAQIPLHYIGIHVSALRGCNLQAVWAIKAFDEQRKIVGHKTAHHWHGFFRVSDTILDAVLSRSGAAGIFMVPKTSDHKHDQQWSTCLARVSQKLWLRLVSVHKLWV